MTRISLAPLGRLCAVGLLLTVGGCGALRSTGTPPPAFYALDSARIETAVARPAPATSSKAAPALIVNPPRAAAGFDSQRILYVREPHQLEYFAHSEWVDTPARMLAPLIVFAAENSGTFRSVMLAPTAAAGDLRLDTEIVRLQQEFASQPSRVHFTLRAHLVDNTTRRVLAWRVFDESVAAATEDPYGGVVAANRAVQTVLEQLAGFCATAAAQWQPATPVLP
ncbi:MAG TPA: ABC-type transport auxiliary lipoprotein family protein [Accumulibacter sp.]|uniref:ABC-type transport auxiliary lipoprotein family protein n=1 Tax=Accumulibacter sp. TaxID=2053492 RepID=UPI0026016664|nr:ABC-type transport auxiliary lipoprotein family protein [Accumulibacter sp.]HRD88795.1 ABC-type transport auxiliary lipoprotein family protein [Accumulibacter sp.]